MAEYYARKEYVYDGGDRIFSIPFSYTDKKYIKVLINDEATSEYEYLNDSQIVIDKHLITGDIITVVRETPIKEKFVTFTDTSILSASQQNLAQDQAFDAIQEIYDNNEAFKNATNDNLADNKQELENIIETNKQEILGIQSDFEDEVNTKIQQVSDAAKKINELEEAVNTAVTAANTATSKAESAAVEANKATEQANLATQKADEATNVVEKSLANIEATTKEEINKIKQTGFYMKNGELYYIDANGKEKEYISSSLNNPYSLFDFKWADHKLNNVSWVVSLNQWNNKTRYLDAYNELLTEFNNTESVEETFNGVTYKRTPKKYLIATADQETAVDSLYNSTGVAWIYLLDTTNQRFKLPRTRYGFVGSRNSVGGYVSESLPNIIGSLNGAFNSDNVTGAFRFTDTMANQSSTSNSLVGGFTFDASRVSLTYQNNAPVQQRATEMYLYFYVGETVQNPNLINAGEIGEQLATKASVDDIDGAFTPAPLSLVNGTTYTVGTTHDTKTLVQFDISNYLPVDSNEYDYEVRLDSEGYATNNSTILWIDTPSIADISSSWSDQVNTSGFTVGGTETQIIPKGYKKISVYLRSTNQSIELYSHLIGYRRLRKGA